MISGEKLGRDEGKSSIRGVASLVVVIAHANQIFLLRYFGLDYSSAKLFGQLAAQAVMVFFLVSGYLITASILKNIRRNAGQFDLLSYSESRISRIYPPLIFSVLLCLVIYSVICVFSLPGGQAPYGLLGDLYIARVTYEVKMRDFLGLLLMKDGFLQANGPLWSLYIEWRIYIAAGCLALLITVKHVSHKILVGVLLLYVLLGLRKVDPNALFYAGIWAMGACAALVEINASDRLYKISRYCWMFPVVVLLCFIASDPYILLNSWRLGTNGERSFQFAFGILWGALLFRKSWLSNALDRTALRWVGGFSYTLYIVHFPLMLLVLSLTQEFIGYSFERSLFVAASSVLFVVVLSFFAGRYIEKKERFLPIVRHALRTIMPVHRHG